MALTALLLINTAHADIRPSTPHSIYSKVLDEERKLLIQLPLHLNMVIGQMRALGFMLSIKSGWLGWFR
ncbi:MAG: hypothetical protein HRT35_21930 [Algicola sp.]|nr:hypothetical protein [Algicola sp.]